MNSMENEYKLAVCIPNYNRSGKLNKLLNALAQQILENDLDKEVEICISDDNSPESPDDIINNLKAKYPKVKMTYRKNAENRGMDYNFLRCVTISSGEYCWIVGNDDEIEPESLKTILHYISDEDIDILVSPFDVYGDDDDFLEHIVPLRTDGNEIMYFHTGNENEYNDLIERVQTGDALFCFLANVVFKKSRWIEHGSMFDDKMDTIFIQMYMNLQTIKDGAVYAYISDKIIKNHADPSVNITYKREYDILVGLNGVIEYFFDGRQHDKLQECIVDPRINGRMWGLPDNTLMKLSITNIRSAKNEYYKKYFVKLAARKAKFKYRNIILYGAGNLGQQAVEELSWYDIGSLSVYDSAPAKWGTELEGYRINNAENLVKDYQKNQSIVVVANNRALVEIINMLLQKGINDIALIN